MPNTRFEIGSKTVHGIVFIVLHGEGKRHLVAFFTEKRDLDLWMTSHEFSYIDTERWQSIVIYTPGKYDNQHREVSARAWNSGERWSGFREWLQ